MKSELPKVLHQIGDRPMICVLLDTLASMSFDRIVVVIGYKGELVEQALAGYPVEFAWQREQLGTGHAVLMTSELMSDFEGTTLVAAGDVPFLSQSSISSLIELHETTGAAATCLSAVFEDPTGYGRIIRGESDDDLMGIIEHKDASPEILTIKEINSGTFCFDNRQLFAALELVDCGNAQGEYYLTDTATIMRSNGLRVVVSICENPDEVRGVNSMEQLKQLEHKFLSD